MLILGIIIICLCGILGFLCSKIIKAKKLKQTKQQLQKDIQMLNSVANQLTNKASNETKRLEELDLSLRDTKKDYQHIKSQYEDKKTEYNKLNQQIIKAKKENNQFYEQEKQETYKRLEDFKQVTEKAAEQYFDNLEKEYEIAEAGHAEKMTRLKEELNGAAADLQKLQETRKAAHQALLKQKEIKENKDNYRLLPSSIDLQDISALRRVKETLHKPRILSMLIWQTYFQPLAKEKFPIILQDKTKMGIYKITNINTDQCYIGQSVDIYKRWTDHCKAGLGIDAPAGNKLYKSMQEDGLYNFTFQLLCECSKQELDEKEKYFISLYQSDLYGFNSTKGNK